MTWVLHPGGEARYYLSLVQVHDINTAQLREPGSCSAENADNAAIDAENTDNTALNADNTSNPAITILTQIMPQ